MKSIKKYEATLLGGKKYTITKRTIEKGTQYTPHWHDFFEFEIITQGYGEHIYNNIKYPVYEGDAYLMTINDFHALCAKSDITVITLHFTDDIIPEEIRSFLLTSYDYFKCNFDEVERTKIYQFLDEISRDSKEDNLYRDINIKNAITSIIIKLLRKSNNIESGYMPSLVQRAVSYISNNFRNDIALTDVAAHFSVTPNYMGKILTKWTNASFSEHINTIRIKYACNLLLTTDLTTKEIAFASGFNSVEYFMYIFKNKILTTPTKYRKENRTVST